MGIRYTQPQYPVEIDWGNPLVQALGLVDVWIPSFGLFSPTLIRKFVPVSSVGSFVSDVNTSGIALRYTAATANNGLIIANDADELFPVANTASIFVIRQCSDTTARTSTLFGYHVGTTGPDRTLAHVPYSDGNIYWDLGDTTTSTRISVASGGKTLNKEAYAFIGGPTKGREIWRNGIKLAGDATKTGARAATTASFRIGSSSNGTSETSDLQGVNLFIIGSKEWPDWAIKALSDNPWQVFRSSRNIWVAGTGGTSLALTGQGITASLGSLIASASPSVTGQVVSLAQGTPVANVSSALTGQAVSLSQGQLVADVTTALTGQAIPISQGTVTVQASGAITAALTGQSATVVTGSVSANVSQGITGQATALAQGTVTPDVTTSLAGQSVVLSGGTVAGNVSVGVSGQNVLLAQGDVSVVGAPVTQSLTGQAVSISQGNITVEAAPQTSEQFSGGWDLPAPRRKTKEDIRNERIVLGILKKPQAVEAIQQVAEVVVESKTQGPKPQEQAALLNKLLLDKGLITNNLDAMNSVLIEVISKEIRKMQEIQEEEEILLMLI